MRQSPSVTGEGKASLRLAGRFRNRRKELPTFIGRLPHFIPQKGWGPSAGGRNDEIIGQSSKKRMNMEIGIKAGLVIFICLLVFLPTNNYGKRIKSFILALSLTINFALAQQYDFTVAKDGSGDFKTVQEAINAVPDFRKNTTTIFIKNGVYKEKLTLPATKTGVTFIGEDKEKTVLTNDDYASKKNVFGEEVGTTGSSGFFVFGDEFTAKNITFENSAGAVGQAVAVRVDGDKVFFENCRFLGFQDTLYPHGKNSRQYYKDCYIEGTTDFIFGWSTAVFDNCEVFAKEGGQYITAASTEEGTPYGFVFMNCRITGNAPDKSYYLGRPWRPFAKTVFINCFLGKVVKPEGWHNWSKPEAEKTTFYAEYNSSGPGANAEERVNWSHQLSKADLDKYTLEKIFNGWTPGEK